MPYRVVAVDAVVVFLQRIEMVAKTFSVKLQVYSSKFTEKAFLIQMFSRKLCAIFRNAYYVTHLWMAAPDQNFVFPTLETKSVSWRY